MKNQSGYFIFAGMSSTRLDQIRQFLKESPEDSFLLFALAKEYEKLGQLDEAISTFDQLLKSNENYTGAYYHLGKVYVQKEAFQKAVVVYKKGMSSCEQEGATHDLSELRGAMMELDFD